MDGRNTFAPNTDSRDMLSKGIATLEERIQSQHLQPLIN